MGLNICSPSTPSPSPSGSTDAQGNKLATSQPRPVKIITGYECASVFERPVWNFRIEGDGFET